MDSGDSSEDYDTFVSKLMRDHGFSENFLDESSSDDKFLKRSNLEVSNDDLHKSTTSMNPNLVYDDLSIEVVTITKTIKVPPGVLQPKTKIRYITEIITREPLIESEDSSVDYSFIDSPLKKKKVN